MQANNFISAYYDAYDEEGRLGSRRGSVEYQTTMRYIQKYIHPGAKVLEIGAGTGRYSLALAQAGCCVDAVEPVASNLAKLRQKLDPHLDLRAIQADARDLSVFDANTYDAVLLLGPMYHLFTVKDQTEALVQALRVLKPGGFLYAAYCMADASIVCYGFMRGNIEKLIAQELLDPVTYQPFCRPEEIFQLYRKTQIDALIAPLPVRRLHFVGADMATRYMDSVIDGMDEAMFSRYLDYHFSICERQDLVGASHHTLDVLEKLP